jgi:hypothetical protein
MENNQSNLVEKEGETDSPTRLSSSRRTRNVLPFSFVFLLLCFETWSHYGTQTGLDLGDSPASASGVLGFTGVCHHDQFLLEEEC